MKRFIACFLLLLFSGLLQAETVTGILDGVNPSSNGIVVSGVAYEVNIECVPVYYEQRRISNQELHTGD